MSIVERTIVTSPALMLTGSAPMVVPLKRIRVPHKYFRRR
jgi:hypothetical protein